jgi:hypothetical protein
VLPVVLPEYRVDPIKERPHAGFTLLSLREDVDAPDETPSVTSTPVTAPADSGSGHPEQGSTTNANTLSIETRNPSPSGPQVYGLPTTSTTPPAHPAPVPGSRSTSPAPSAAPNVADKAPLQDRVPLPGDSVPPTPQRPPEAVSATTHSAAPPVRPRFDKSVKG